MRHSWLDNLRTISEYVYFDDAPGLLGITKKDLRLLVRDKAVPDSLLKEKIARIAGRFRRREAQVKRYTRADEQRKARRDAHATLRLIGKDHLKLPDRLPPFLREYDYGKLASPVYIYDFRNMTPNDVVQFFRFMKHVVPQGHFFLTYEVKPDGTSPEGGKKFWNTTTIIMSTKYHPFCVGSGRGNCLMQTDFELLDFYMHVNDSTAKRQVIECGISYPRPIQFTEEEKEEDRLRGADPLTGLIYIYQD